MVALMAAVTDEVNETAGMSSLALTAAETGHLVFGTLHSNSAPKTVDRIIDVFPSSDKEMIRAMLSGSLQGVVSQSLMRRVNGGRVAAHEILVGTNAVRNLIRENKIPQLYSMMQTGLRYGMVTMEDSVRDLVEAGIVSEEEALSTLAAVSEGGEDITLGHGHASDEGENDLPSGDGSGGDQGSYSF